jgi:predicted Zn-dependent peptidase
LIIFECSDRTPTSPNSELLAAARRLRTLQTPKTAITRSRNAYAIFSLNWYNHSYSSLFKETMQIKEMTAEQLQNLIRTTIDEMLDEYFGDPDEDKEIKESFKQSLLEIRRKRQEGRPTIPLAEVYKRYGIER